MVRSRKSISHTAATKAPTTSPGFSASRALAGFPARAFGGPGREWRRAGRFGGIGRLGAAPLKDERMNRARRLAALSRRNFLALSASAAVGAGLVGCKHGATPPAAQTRSQIGEDPADAETVPTIGSK